jgi:2,4-dienoyl-CoA reductase (NADPH2)
MTTVDSPYPHLFSPVTVGRTTIRNRTAMLPMGTRLCPDGTVNDAERAWSEERARGGLGVMIAGGALVHPTSNTRSNPVGLVEGWHERGVEGQRRRVDAVHAHGTKIFGQFLHLGRDAATGAVGGLIETPTLAPSPLRSPTTEWAPRQMDAGDIRMVVEAFGHTAALFQLSGMDGLEIHGAHNYLIGQFLSAYSNRRDDEYGVGTLENRMRFLLEVIEEVRDRVGGEMTLGVRLSAVEEVPGGLTVDDTKAFAERLQATGAVDYLSLTVGVRGAYVKDNTWPLAVAAPYAAQVRAVTDLKLLVGGRITNPEIAERILAEGTADLVGMGRALIADPELPAKARAGEASRIRPCLGFAQDCRLSQGGVTCAVNAAAGRETTWSAVLPPTTGRRRRVVIAGGGPGGLEAARVAGSAGHEVVLYEATEQLGGQLLRAARAPYREDWARYAAYLEREVRALPVDVRLGTPATPAVLLADEPDLVIVATGSTPSASEVVGEPDSVPLVSTWDLLDGTDSKPGTRVLLVDDGSGFWEVCGAADHLVRLGVQVAFATPNAMIGRSVPHESIALLHKRLRAAGTDYLPFTRLRSVGPGSARVVDMLTGDERDLEVDAVVVQLPNRPVDDLVRALAARAAEGVTVRAIGDSVSPRRLTYATLDANRVVRELSTVH